MKPRKPHETTPLLTPKKVTFHDPGPWKTPNKVVDLTLQLAKLNIANKGSREQRLLFRKVEKAFDLKDLSIAMLKTENEALKARLWDLEHKKRKKVEITPNSKFARIRHLRRSRRADPDYSSCTSEESDVSSLDETQSCIEIPSIRGRR